MRTKTARIALLSLITIQAIGVVPTLAADEKIEKIIVTGTRIGAVPEDKLGTAVTILDKQQIEQRQTRYVSDILRDVPGAAVNRSGAAGGSTQVRLRGVRRGRAKSLPSRYCRRARHCRIRVRDRRPNGMQSASVSCH